VLLDDAAHARYALTNERLDLVWRQMLTDARRPNDVGEERRYWAQLVLVCATQQLAADGHDLFRGLVRFFVSFRNGLLWFCGVTMGGTLCVARSRSAGLGLGDLKARGAEPDDVVRAQRGCITDPSSVHPGAVQGTKIGNFEKIACTPESSMATRNLVIADIEVGVFAAPDQQLRLDGHAATRVRTVQDQEGGRFDCIAVIRLVPHGK
jgi:hypothetical protein